MPRNDKETGIMLKKSEAVTLRETGKVELVRTKKGFTPTVENCPKAAGALIWGKESLQMKRNDATIHMVVDTVVLGANKRGKPAWIMSCSRV